MDQTRRAVAIKLSREPFDSLRLAACFIASALSQHFGRLLGDELFDLLSSTAASAASSKHTGDKEKPGEEAGKDDQ